MQEIGRRLQAAREAKGVSLQVVEEETKIRRKYIEALEAGRETDLPGSAYLKGFLRTYGNYLGLDGPALVEEYKQQQGTAQGHGEARAPHAPAAHGPVEAPPQENRQVEAERPVARPAQAPRPAPQEAPPVRPARPRPHETRRSGTAPKAGAPRFPVVAVVAVLLLAAVAYLGWQIFKPGPEPQTQPPVTQPPPVAEKKPDPTPPVVVPEPPKVTMTRGTGSDVIFTVPGQSIEVRFEPGPNPVWTRTVVDGAATFTDATLTAPRDFKANQTLTIRVGHMENVSLVVNGQRFEKPLDNKPYNLIFNRQQ